jgi:hypothetical protein
MDNLFINYALLGNDLADAIKNGNKDSSYGFLTILSSYAGLAGQLTKVMGLLYNNLKEAIDAESSKIVNYDKWIESTVMPDSNTIFISNRLSWLLYYMFKKDDEILDDTHEIDFNECVAIYDPISSLYKPGYFIMIDSYSKSIVIGLRGTTITAVNISDLLTDLDHDVIDEYGGKFHKGMYTAAKALYEKYGDIIKYLVEKNPEYKLRIVGHSLGGGVAIILGFILRASYPRLKVFSYGTPCIGSIQLIEESRKFAITFINADDIVSRLSLFTITNLELMLKGKSLSSDNADALLPLGTIHQMRYINGKLYVNPNEDPKYYTELILNNSIFDDHWLDRYVMNMQYLTIEINANK